MEKTEFSIQIDTAEEPMKQEEAVSKVHEKLEKQEPLIELRNIYKIYYMGDEEVHANDGISLSINKGEFVAIVGKSGSGKSTLMNIIGALDVPTEGEYFLGGEDVADMSDNELAEIRNRMIGFIFQQYNLLPKLNLLENVELPLLYAGYDKKERRERAMNSLKKVGLDEKWKNLPNQLSGGQQQRVSIARALAGDPSLILADEPTGALDSRTGREVLDFLKKLNEEGNTIVMITHEMNVVKQICERVVVMNQGEIVESGDVIDIFSRPQSETTRALIGNVMARDLPESVIRVFRNARENAEEGKSVHLLRLAFVGSEVTKPVISECSQRFHVNLSILRGTVDDLHGRTLGTLTVLVETPIADYIRVIEFIRSRGVIVEELNDVL